MNITPMPSASLIQDKLDCPVKPCIDKERCRAITEEESHHFADFLSFSALSGGYRDCRWPGLSSSLPSPAKHDPRNTGLPSDQDDCAGFPAAIVFS
jgi:hypothetical protein